MGIFGKLFGGGLKVKVQAPASVPSNEVIPVNVTITSDKTVSIEQVKVEIKSQAKEQGMTLGNGGVGTQEGMTNQQTVAVAENRDTFTVSGGEDKTLNMQLFVSGNGNGNNLNTAAMPGAIGGALSAIANIASNIDHVNYIYSVHAIVSVQGKKLHVHDSQPIQLLPPQNSGGQPPQSMQAVEPAAPPQAAQPQPPAVPINPLPFVAPQVQQPPQEPQNNEPAPENIQQPPLS
jgi:hypothetical protein